MMGRQSLLLHEILRLTLLSATIATIPAPVGEQAARRATADIKREILTGGEGGWSRISAPVSL